MKCSALPLWERAFVSAPSYSHLKRVNYSLIQKLCKWKRYTIVFGFFFVYCNIILHLKWMKEQVLLFVFKKIKIGIWQHRILKWFKTPERPAFMVTSYSLCLSCERLRVVVCMRIKEFKVKPPSGRWLHHMQNKCLHVYALLGSLGKCEFVLQSVALTHTGGFITAVVLEKTLPAFADNPPPCRWKQSGIVCWI